jgi:transposase
MTESRGDIVLNPLDRRCPYWGPSEELVQLDVEPAKYFVLVTKREKRACRSCEEFGVVSAPLPPRIVEKCLASDRIVIDTFVSKYCNHLPLHRQKQRY